MNSSKLTIILSNHISFYGALIHPALEVARGSIFVEQKGNDIRIRIEYYEFILNDNSLGYPTKVMTVLSL